MSHKKQFNHAMMSVALVMVLFGLFLNFAQTDRGNRVSGLAGHEQSDRDIWFTDDGTMHIGSQKAGTDFEMDSGSWAFWIRDPDIKSITKRDGKLYVNYERWGDPFAIEIGTYDEDTKLITLTENSEFFDYNEDVNYEAWKTFGDSVRKHNTEQNAQISSSGDTGSTPPIQKEDDLVEGPNVQEETPTGTPAGVPLTGVPLREEFMENKEGEQDNTINNLLLCGPGTGVECADTAETPEVKTPPQPPPSEPTTAEKLKEEYDELDATLSNQYGGNYEVFKGQSKEAIITYLVDTGTDPTIAEGFYNEKIKPKKSTSLNRRESNKNDDGTGEELTPDQRMDKLIEDVNKKEVQKILDTIWRGGSIDDYENFEYDNGMYNVLDEDGNEVRIDSRTKSIITYNENGVVTKIHSQMLPAYDVEENKDTKVSEKEGIITYEITNKGESHTRTYVPGDIIYKSDPFDEDGYKKDSKGEKIPVKDEFGNILRQQLISDKDCAAKEICIEIRRNAKTRQILQIGGNNLQTKDGRKACRADKKEGGCQEQMSEYYISKIGPAIRRMSNMVREGQAIADLLGISTNNAWKRKMDNYFQTDPFGQVLSGRWEDSICSQKIDTGYHGTVIIGNQGQPPGVGIHIEGERHEKVSEFNDTTKVKSTEYLYKFIIQVKNPLIEYKVKRNDPFVSYDYDENDRVRDKNSQSLFFNVMLTGEGGSEKLFPEDEEVEPGRTKTYAGESMVRKYLPRIYDKACITLDKEIKSFDGDKITEVCNDITTYTDTITPYSGG